MKKIAVVLILASLVVPAMAVSSVTWGPLNGINNGISVGYGLGYPQGQWAVELIFTNLQDIPGYTNGSTLTTFCLERNETFITGGNNTYSAVVNDGAVSGGNGGATNGYDPICNQTAWLYKEYIGGNDFGIANLNQRAAYVQEALWFFEDEITALSWAANGSQSIIDQANAAVAGGYTNSTVKVLNLTYPNGTNAQDVLIIVPTVPVPGAVILGGIGVGLVGWFKKRKSL